MSQQEAQNIITYVGVPLAVLGVLPTLSTTLQSLLTQRAIRQTLNANGISALTRSSLLSGIVEIEIPRLSLQPLDRNDPAYWKLREHKSGLRGGSWTLFYWNEMTIGSKSYRLQYHDELVQPQAEIGFEALVAFILDRGAVPCQQGLADLRSSGLWTPAGTKLLLSPTTTDAVLMVARSDDSDGILSLSLVWEEEWDRRRDDKLPPYWIRIRPGLDKDHSADGEDNEKSHEESKVKEMTESNESQASSNEHASDLALPSPVRIRISASGVEQAYHEDSPKLPLQLPQFFNANPQATMSATCLWFNIACTALVAPSGNLWSFAIPNSIITFSHRDTVPCGILVLLGLLSDEDVPAWRNTDGLARIEQEEIEYENTQRQLKRANEIQKELRMPREEAQKHRMDRMKEEMWEIHNDHHKDRLRAERRAEKEKSDAIVSPRLGASVVSEGARKWLVKNKKVSSETGATCAGVVEKGLYTMIGDSERASAIGNILEKWRIWTDAGGMTRANFEDVGQDLEVFCYAACILGLVKDTSAHPTGSVISDLQECMRMWKKVRLG